MKQFGFMFVLLTNLYKSYSLKGSSTLKRVFTISLLFILSSMFFVACKTETEENHEHKFATAWSSDETNHWHAATCEHADQKADLSAHTWDSGVVTRESTEELEGERKYTCTICNATKTAPIAKLAHTHKYATAWSRDETSHWHAATCEHTDQRADLAAHTWDSGVIARESTEELEGERKYTCTVCNATKTEPIAKLAHTHKYATAWSSDETNHWHAATCEHTDQRADLAAHTWDSGVVTRESTEELEGERKYTCTVCNATKTEPIAKLAHTHKYATAWSSDETNHWHAATCEHTDQKADLSAHTWDSGVIARESTEELEGERKYTCTVCNATKTEPIAKLAHTHKYATAWSSDETNHWHAATCEHTDQRADLSAHTWDSGVIARESTEEAEGERKYTCTVCNATKTEPIAKLAHTHKYATTWSSDETNHWHAATCEHTDQKADLATHSWNSGVITKIATEESEGEKTYNCIYCGETRTEVISKLAHTHKFSTAWTTDDLNHWHAATCEHSNQKANLGNHIWGTGVKTKTESKNITTYTCTICGKEKVEEETRLFSVYFFKRIPKKDGTYDVVETTSQQVEYGTKISLPNLEVAGYTFEGWYEYGDWNYTNGQITNTEIEIKSSVGYISKFSITKYAIIYNNLLDGINNSANPATYDIFTEVTLKNPSRTGYSFSNWYTDENFVDKKTVIPEGSINNVVLYAKWVPKTYNITYKLDGGTNNENNPTSVTFDNPKILENPTKQGFEFEGWFFDSSYTNPVTQIPVASMNSTTIYAKWIDMRPKYKVTFNSNGGSSVLAQTVRDGDCASEPSAPKKTGYFFDGWVTENGGSIKYNFSEAITENITLYASWSTSITCGSGNLNTILGNVGSGTVTVKLTAVNYSTLKTALNNNKSVYVKLDLSDCTTPIPTKAFYCCTNLKTVIMPKEISSEYSNSANYIPDYAFYGCTGLTSIDMSKCNNYIGYQSFYDCSSLQMVSIPSAITRIGDSAFYGCSKLSYVSFGKVTGWTARHIRLNEVVDMASNNASTLAKYLRGDDINGKYSKDWEWSNY